MSLFNRAFDDILRLQHALDRAFGQPFHGFDAPSGRGVYPGLNVFESGDAILVKAEVPGLAREQLGVEVEGNRLVLTGSRVAPKLEEGCGFHRRERAFGEFRRVFRLPFEVDREKTTATYRDGVLTVRLEKAETAKPRQITVQG